jgi:hypothetical protein
MSELCNICGGLTTYLYVVTCPAFCLRDINMHLVISAFIVDQPYQQVAGDWGKYFCKEDFHDLYQTSVRYHLGEQIKEDEMDSAGMGEYKINRFWLTQRKPHLEDLGIDEMGSCKQLSDEMENFD